MENVLIVIDYVNDFVAADGRLTCGRPAQEIEGALCRAVEDMAASGGCVAVASDLHEHGDTHHPESGLFPAHCLAGTPGRALYGGVAEAVGRVRPDRLIVIDKTRYSAFAGTNLDQLLRERDARDVYLAGVCTDICVLHTAVDAYNLGYRIHVYERAVASFNPEGHAFALSHFKSALGAEIL